MTKHFLLFREGRRLRAAQLELPSVEAPLLVEGRRFVPAGGLWHLNHITDERQHLLGFVVQSLKDANTSTEWRAWWDTFDNREVIDFWEAYLYLADPMPAQWHDDCALLVGGGWVFADGAGDYVLAIPDDNGVCFRPGEPTEFWKELGFELKPLSVAVEGSESAAC